MSTYQTPQATLPTGWDETPLLAYCRLAAATDANQRAIALAALVQMPAETVLADMRVYAAVRRDLPFLDTLPEAEAPVLSFTHAGTTYEHVGHLETISTGQFEALLATLQAHEAAPVLSAPALLALLYRPVGLPLAEWTAARIETVGLAFETLPMSIAWPAVGFFLRVGLTRWLSFHQFLQVKSSLTDLLTTLEASLLPTTASGGFASKLRKGAVRRLLQSGQSLLSNS